MAPSPLRPPPDCRDLDLHSATRTATSFATELGGVRRSCAWRVGVFRSGTVGEPLLFVPDPAIARYRFDDPHAAYSVWYGSRTPEGAFLEVFGDLPRGFVTPAQRDGRVCGQVAIDASLLLLDLRSPAVNSIVHVEDRLDDRIGTTELYSLTQSWSRRFFECDDGIGPLDRSRLGGEKGPNVAIFLERAAGILAPVDAGTSVDDALFEPARQQLALSGVQWP